MRRLIILALALAFAAHPAQLSNAEVDPVSPAVDEKGYQLVIVEAEGCIYCNVFRRDVLPAFEASERGRHMSVRFLDVNDIEAAKLDLNSGVDIVPTFVVARHNREIGRIPGYVGPENFFHSIDRLMATAP